MKESFGDKLFRVKDEGDVQRLTLSFMYKEVIDGEEWVKHQMICKKIESRDGAMNIEEFKVMCDKMEKEMERTLRE